jgi:ferredoxin-type protein NapH
MAAALDKLGRDAIASKGWWLAYRWLVLRRLTQIAIFVLFLLGPWAGIWIIKGNLSSSLLLDKVPMTDPLLLIQMFAAGFLGVTSTALIGAAIVLAFYLIVGGRVYCAWVCPINIVTDAAAWLRRKLDIKTTARIDRKVRYWFLALTIVLAFATGSLAYELINPVSMVHRGLIFGMGGAWAVVAAVFLFDLFVTKRGWCSHVCPMGAFYGIIGNVGLVRVRADRREACNDCMECYEVCPEPHVIPPALKGAPKGLGPVILSGDCTNCGRCIDICSKEVFTLGLRFPATVKAASANTPHGNAGATSDGGIGKEGLLAMRK